MTVKLWRPFLIGGVSLTLLVWTLETLNHTLGGFGTLMMLLAGGVGVGRWLTRSRSLSSSTAPLTPASLDRTTVEQAITETETVLSQLQTEASTLEANSGFRPPQQQLRSQVAQVIQELDREEIRLVVLGGKATGKTTVTQLLQLGWLPQLTRQVTLQDTPALLEGTESGMAAEVAAWQVALNSDLALFLIDGDLTEPELQVLRRLVNNRKRTILLLNKQDQYLPVERQTLLQQLHLRTRDISAWVEIVAIAAAPVPIKVRQHQADKSVQEWMEQPRPDLSQLLGCLNRILAQDTQQLVLANCLNQAVTLKTEARTALNGVRRVRAMPVIEQYQWVAAATTFANPFPALDLLATAAINAHMVMELSNLYQQKLTFSQAQTVATNLATLMLKLGLVEFSTQTIGIVLKSNAITYVAGGALQGVSAAYLTRMAGLSLVEYFQAQEKGVTSATLQLDQMAKVLRQVFQQNQRITLLQSFVKQVLDHLFTTKPTIPQLSATVTQPLQLDPPETEILGENREAVRLSVPSLDSTSVPSA